MLPAEVQNAARDAVDPQGREVWNRSRSVATLGGCFTWSVRA